MVERLVHIVDDAEVLADAGDLTLVCVLTGFLDAGKSAELRGARTSGALRRQGGGDLRRRLAARLPRPPAADDVRARPLRRLRGTAPGRPRRCATPAARRTCCCTGPEPDIRWEAFARAVREVVEHFGVSRVVSMGAVPMAVPHTRPIAITPHANRPELVHGESPWQGELRVPASAQALLEIRLGEWGLDALGFVAHIPHYLAQMEYPQAALVLLEHARDRRAADDRPQRPAGGRRDHGDRGRPLPLLARRGRRRRTRPRAAVRRLPRGRGGRHVAARGDDPLPTGEELGQDFEAVPRRPRRPVQGRPATDPGPGWEDS